MAKIVLASSCVAALGSPTEGACSADEQTAMSADASCTLVGPAADLCLKSSYNVLTGSMSHAKFNDCFTNKVPVSDGCSECYAAFEEKLLLNCQQECGLGAYCGRACVDCKAAAEAELDACTGDLSGSSVPMNLSCCQEGSVSAGACSADDQAALDDAAKTGQAMFDCSYGGYGFEFNDCFMEKLGVSAGCSSCYAAQAEYDANHCKAACLLGWCKQDCLDCSGTAEPKAALDACVGFATSTAEPCNEDEDVSLVCVESDLEKIHAYNPPSQLPPRPTWEEVVSQCQKDACTLSLIGMQCNNITEFSHCVSTHVDGLSESCLQCELQQNPFTDRVQSCKVSCLLGWCKQACQDCLFPNGPFNYTNPCDGSVEEMKPSDPCDGRVVAHVLQQPQVIV